MENKSGENSDNFNEFQEISCGKYPWKANQGEIQIISRNFKKNQGENIQKTKKIVFMFFPNSLV